LFLDRDGVIIESRDHIYEPPDNRWIKLAELIPWNELEDGYAAQFCKGFGAPAKLFRMALGAWRTLRRGPAAAVETCETRGF
jgi:hypothetical protein